MAAAPVPASALEIGFQDQGVSLKQYGAVAGLLGASTARIIVRTDDAQAALVREYREHGYRVQAAILVKRDTTAGDIRAVLRAWNGQVDTVSVGNEPELNGIPACTYSRLYRRAYSMIRREFPGVRVGMGEFSPNGWSYLQQLRACPGRIRASFIGVHAYQFWSDPLAAPSIERVADGSPWIGLGTLGRLHRELSRRATRRKMSTSGYRTLPIRVTEFSYLVSGRYKITPEHSAWLWPRAVKQARKWARQLVIYGAGPVAEGSWGDASLLGRDGQRLPGLLALARALGRVLPPEHVPPDPVPVEALPGLPDVAPLSHGEGQAASPPVLVDPEPVVIEDPPLEEPAPDPPAEPTPDPATDPTVETPPETPVTGP